MNKNHFTCVGDCKSVSDVPGICQADFCNKKGEELMICGCEDGAHTVDTGRQAETQGDVV